MKERIRINVYMFDDFIDSFYIDSLSAKTILLEINEKFDLNQWTHYEIVKDWPINDTEE